MMSSILAIVNYFYKNTANFKKSSGFLAIFETNLKIAESMISQSLYVKKS